MSWRGTQLGDQCCDQDNLILNLFKGKTVNYVGDDIVFRQRLSYNPASTNLVIVLNNSIWISGIIAVFQQYLRKNIETFYLGVNRYQVLGNDTNRDIKCTNNYSNDLIQLITDITQEHEFEILQSGHHNQDLGRYFNFVQPLTWVYGQNITNQSHQ